MSKDPRCQHCGRLMVGKRYNAARVGIIHRLCFTCPVCDVG